MTKHSLITVNNVHYAYGNKAVLKGLNLNIEAGKVYGVLGANGAGKTTLINLLLGRLTPNQGSISVLGKKAGSVEVKAQVGAMLQIGGLPPNLTIREQLNLFASYYTQSLCVDKTLRLSGLNEHQNTQFSQLSGGLKQRLLFAIAIIGNPKIVFLDEPSLAMDVNARKQMWQTITRLKSQGKTIILTTHYMEEAEALSDELFILNDGKIVAQGSARDLSEQMQMSQVRFKTTLSQIELEQKFTNWEWQLEGGMASTYCQSPTQLLKALFNAAIECEHLSVTPASLEQTFISLTEQEQAA